MKLRLAFAALLLTFVATSAWLSVRITRQRDQIAQLEARLNQGIAPQPAPAPAGDQPAPAQPAPRESRVPNEPVVSTPACPDTASLNTRLHETASTLARAQARIAELESQMDDLNRERTRIATHETQMQAQITDLNQTISAMHDERPQLTRRIKDAEAETARLRQQVQSVDQKNTQFTQLTADFKDLARRQQVATTNALRRYRELTDLFRSLPGMVEVRGNGPELARIQSAISLADEDLRQLNDLNTRLTRLQTQITTSR